MKPDAILAGYSKPLSRQTIESAINLYKTGVYKRCPMYANVITQLAYSLAIYAERGEFKGEYAEAIECLKQAQYEIEGDSNP